MKILLLLVILILMCVMKANIIISNDIIIN